MTSTPSDQTTERSLTRLIEAARLAPSADNCQPWRLVRDGSALRVEFHGRRQPCWPHVDEMLRRNFNERPDIWDMITRGGTRQGNGDVCADQSQPADTPATVRLLMGTIPSWDKVSSTVGLLSTLFVKSDLRRFLHGEHGLKGGDS